MSSIRLFILDAFERHGEMHGHQLRLQAEEERISLWTDISVGGLYGAIKRLADDDLLEVVRTERKGIFPERHVYALTDAGREALVTLRFDGLRDVSMKPDPFDLAVTRLDPARLDELAQGIDERLATLRMMLADSVELHAHALPYLTVVENHSIGHREHRIRAEIEWHEQLVAALPAIVADESARQHNA